MAVNEWDASGVHYSALTEFPWDVDQPEADHLAWARRYGREIGRLGGNVHFVGTADQSPGRTSPGYNQELSVRRARKVCSAVQRALPASVSANLHIHGVGSNLAAGPSNSRWPTDRAVVVAHVHGVQPPGEELPAWMRCIDAPCTSTVFFLRMVGALSTGANIPGTLFGFSAVIMHLLVSDGQWALSFNIKLGEWSGGVGLGPPVSINVTNHGPWNLIRIRDPILVSGFRNCIVEMANVGVGGGAAGSTTILRMINPAFYLKDFQGGATFGTAWLELGGTAHARGGVERDSARVVRSGPSRRALEAFGRGAKVVDDELLPFR